MQRREEKSKGEKERYSHLNAEFQRITRRDKKIKTIIRYHYMSIGEGNGTPLQYSCLENPMDGGAWYAAVPGVAKSWTLLK